MKVKWKDIWYPTGQWMDDKDVVVQLEGNFFCKHEITGAMLICVMIPTKGPTGHGEAPHTAERPHFIQVEGLQNYEVPKGDWIEIN